MFGNSVLPNGIFQFFFSFFFAEFYEYEAFAQFEREKAFFFPHKIVIRKLVQRPCCPE